jgi:hypothetical protein
MTEMSERDRREIGQFIRDVRERIWAWDPARLAGLDAPDDEYDCVVGPVTGWLRQGLRAETLAERLRTFVRQDFGVDPVDTETFAAGLVAWYDAEAKPSAFE